MNEKVKKQFFKFWWFLPVISLVCSSIFTGYIIKNTLNSPTTQYSAIKCAGQQEADFQCWKTYFEAIVYNDSPEESLKQAQIENDKGSYVRSNCHQVAHVIGRASAKVYELNVADTFEHGNQFCASGYYHGAMESVTAEIGAQKVKNTINNICKPFKDKSAYNLKHYDCVHGLGHGVMGMENYELYKAIDDCELLTDAWERDSCTTGVFMENIMSVFNNPDYQTKYLDKDRPLHPCTEVPDMHKNSCYLNQSSYALSVTGYDYAKVFSLCSEAGGSSQICYQSVGRDASGNSIQDPIKTNDICQKGVGMEQQTGCIIGAVKDIIWIGNSKEKGEEFCRLQMEISLKQICESTAESYYATFQ